MKPVLFAFLLCTAPFAYAQDPPKAGCLAYSKIAAAFAANLEPLKGRAIGKHTFEVSTAVPDSDVCEVSESDTSRNYNCSREFPDEASARAGATAAMALAKACLPGWKEVPTGHKDGGDDWFPIVSATLASGKKDEQLEILVLRIPENGADTFFVDQSVSWRRN